MKLPVKSLIIILFLLLAGAVVYFIFPSIFFSDKSFTVTNIESVSKFTLSKKDGTKTVLKKQGEWYINNQDYASPEAIEALLDALSFMQVLYPVPKQQFSSIEQQMITEGIELVYSKNLLKHRYIFYFTDSVTYGRVTGKEQIYVLTMPEGNVSLPNSISPYPSFWRNKLIFALLPSEIKSVGIENRLNPAQSFKITQPTTGEFHLFDVFNSLEAEHIDTLSVKRYLTYFSELNFEQYANLSQQEYEHITASSCVYKLNIESNKDNVELEIYYMPDKANRVDYFNRPLKYDRDRFYLRINGADELVVARWIDFDLLLKDLNNFIR